MFIFMWVVRKGFSEKLMFGRDLNAARGTSKRTSGQRVFQAVEMVSVQVLSRHLLGLFRK